MSSVLVPVRNLWFERLTSPKRLRLYVWLSLATQILIVVTGGLVRLTGSGLGCPTWPKCTDESLVSTSEMGIHGEPRLAERQHRRLLRITVGCAGRRQLGRDGPFWNRRLVELFQSRCKRQGERLARLGGSHSERPVRLALCDMVRHFWQAGGSVAQRSSRRRNR